MSKTNRSTLGSAAATAYVVAALSFISAPASPAASESNPYSANDQSVFLPYVNEPAGAGDIVASPMLRVSFGGDSHLAIMDTGSTGIVVSAADIPGVDGLPSSPGQLIYSSSGRIMMGKWVTTPVTVEGADGARLLTRPMPVLAVDRVECRPDARDCRPEKAPKGVAVLGVGFGREADGQEQSTPDKNPCLAASFPCGKFRRGYVVARTGVNVGLTGAVVSGFVIERLTADARYPGDWSAARSCTALDGRSPSVCGKSLVDTGVTGMYITLPASMAASSETTNSKGEPTLTEGTKLAITFPAAGSAKVPDAAGYSFTVGKAGDPLAPEFVVLNTKRPEPFVNTGVRFLNGLDYLYDADAGMVGYRWTGRIDPRFGSADPSIGKTPGG